MRTPYPTQPGSCHATDTGTTPLLGTSHLRRAGVVEDDQTLRPSPLMRETAPWLSTEWAGPEGLIVFHHPRAAEM